MNEYLPDQGWQVGMATVSPVELGRKRVKPPDQSIWRYGKENAVSDGTNFTGTTGIAGKMVVGEDVNDTTGSEDLAGGVRHAPLIT